MPVEETVQSGITDDRMQSPPSRSVRTYDSENRLLTAPGVQYAYNSSNQRIWMGTLNSSGALTGQSVFVYSAGGQMMGQYSATAGSSSLTVATTQFTVYFGHKRIGVANSSGTTNAFAIDRLGSSGQFYPYGEGKGGNNPADTWSFATYWTDSATGLDYASQRYFSGQFGRFMTPYQAASGGSGNPNNPQTWDRYAYVSGDPANLVDPEGLALMPVVPQGPEPLPLANTVPQADGEQPNDSPCPSFGICITLNPSPTLPQQPSPLPPPSTGSGWTPPQTGLPFNPQPSSGMITTFCGAMTFIPGAQNYINPLCLTGCPSGQILTSNYQCVSYQQELSCQEAETAETTMSGAAASIALLLYYYGSGLPPLIKAGLEATFVSDGLAIFLDQLYIKANCSNFSPPMWTLTQP
jgi:RHS repeat-associated protein